MHLFPIHAPHLILKLLDNFKELFKFFDLISPVPELLSHCFYSNLSVDTEKISIHLRMHKIKLLKQGSGLSGIATTILVQR